MNMHDSTVTQPDDQVTFEVVIAKPKDGTSLAAFLEADATMERDFVAKQPGFLSREVAVSKDGELFVIVRWASLRDAEAAGAGFMTAPTGQARMELSDLSLFAHFIKQ